MEKSKTHYWAIFEGNAPVFEGSFSECWKALLNEYSSYTVRELEQRRIRIARKS